MELWNSPWQAWARKMKLWKSHYGPNLGAWCILPWSWSDHCMKWPHSVNVFWSLLAEGAVVLWTSCCHLCKHIKSKSRPQVNGYQLICSVWFSIFISKVMSKCSRGIIFPSNFGLLRCQYLSYEAIYLLARLNLSGQDSIHELHEPRCY